MMNTETEIDLSEQIRAAFAEANRRAQDAKTMASEAVAKAIECGQLLMAQKKVLGHGRWLAWLDANTPEISEWSARRYMRVAKAAAPPALPEPDNPNRAPLPDLKAATTLKHAYIALGILPKPEPKPPQVPAPNKSWVRFTRHLDGFRLWYHKRIDDMPLDDWPENARRALKNELRWFVHLYEQL